MRYQGSFTSKPGLLGGFVYSFEGIESTPINSHSCPIQFALRDAVREQIKAMQENGITEEGQSANSSPLTTVARENKAPRICVDARKINRIAVAD